MVGNFFGQCRYCLSSSRAAELFKRRFINPGVAVNFQFNFKTFLTDGLNRAQQGSSSGENFSVKELCPRVKLHG